MQTTDILYGAVDARSAADSLDISSDVREVLQRDDLFSSFEGFSGGDAWAVRDTDSTEFVLATVGNKDSLERARRQRVLEAVNFIVTPPEELEIFLLKRKDWQRPEMQRLTPAYRGRGYTVSSAVLDTVEYLANSPTAEWWSCEFEDKNIPCYMDDEAQRVLGIVLEEV